MKIGRTAMRAESTLPRSIDVGHLEATLFDHRSILWWGNLLLLFIETTMFGILAAVYFTVASNTSPFPPVRIDKLPVIYAAAPELFIPTVNLVVLLLSLIPGIWLDLSARKMDLGAVRSALIITLGFNFAAIVLRFFEFNSLLFRWDDNAYGSVIWTILGVHLLHIVVLGFEDVFLLIWTFLKGLDEKHALDLTVTAVYWYWIVGMWVLFYLLVYWAPRII
jgi:cytochrome c oxidase subunit I+III